MNNVRKIIGWLWLAKERFVLLVMIGFLSVRVYNVINPKSDDSDGTPPRPPRVELSDDVERPGIPPKSPGFDVENDWTVLVTRDIFRYERRQERGGADGEDDTALSPIFLLSIQEGPSGSAYKARIRTSGTTKWYDEGESFENYELREIDPDAGCCQIYDESIGKERKVCIDN